MINYYLKTADEDSMIEALEAAGVVFKHYDPDDENNIRPIDFIQDPNDENNVIPNPDSSGDWAPTGKFKWVPIEGVELDLIGTIYTTTSGTVVNDEGVEGRAMAAVEGYHANLRSKDPIDDLPQISKPNTPQRIWAGEVTNG
jgi:hypothetical protein